MIPFLQKGKVKVKNERWVTQGDPKVKFLHFYKSRLGKSLGIYQTLDLLFLNILKYFEIFLTSFNQSKTFFSVFINNFDFFLSPLKAAKYKKGFQELFFITEKYLNIQLKTYETGFIAMAIIACYRLTLSNLCT